MRILFAHLDASEQPGSVLDILERDHALLRQEDHTIDELTVNDLSPRWRSTPFARLAFSWMVYRHVRRAVIADNSYDIVTVSSADLFPVSLFKERLGARIVVAADIAKSGSALAPWRRWLNRADHVLCLNEEQQRYIQLDGILPIRAVSQLIPGVVPGLTDLKARRDFASANRILLSGVFDEALDSPFWINAFAELMLAHPGLELRVLENGPIPNPGIISAFPQSLRARICLLTPRGAEENAAIMADSDLFVFRGLFRHPLQPLVAAMATGMPVVAASSGMRGLLEDGASALVTAVASPDAMIRALQRLIASRELRAQLGTNAQRVATSRLTWQNSAKTLDQTYKRVLRLRSSSERPVQMLFAVHVSRDAETAVYKNTRERVAYLENQGCHCTIVTPEDFAWTRRLGARFTPLLYPVALALWLARRARNYDVATFHSHAGWAVLLLARFSRLFQNLRTVIQFHGLEPLYFARLEEQSRRERRPLSWRYRFVHGRLMLNLLRNSCRAADMVLCLNSEEFRYLVDHKWTERERVHLVANPAPDSFYLQRQHRERAMRLLFVGQWLTMKGTQTLVETFVRLHREFPHLRLLCAGTLADAATVLKDFPPAVRDYVTVFPRVTKSELLELHRQSDLFLFPTQSEGFSLALIEAMASGLPMVTTPVGAAPDILRHGESVVFCPPNDGTAFVEAVSALVDERSRREQLGSNAQRAAAAYHPDSVWRDYAVCLNQLAGRDAEQPGCEMVATIAEDD